MEKYTGNYINIGLISDRKNLREKVVRLISSSDKFWCKKIDYPTDEKYTHWMEEQIEHHNIDVAIDRCIKSNMAWIIGDFFLGKYEIKNVLFQVELLPDNKICFLIEMPEQQNQFFEDIDNAEKVIIQFLKEISEFKFLYGFCDNEAEPEDKHGYAIFVDYELSSKISFQSWKIDGLTNRE